MVAYTDFTLLELFALRTHEFCLCFCMHTINLIAYSCCFNWVNTQIRCLSGALPYMNVEKHFFITVDLIEIV